MSLSRRIGFGGSSGVPIGRFGAEVSHLSNKNKCVAKIGHPGSLLRLIPAWTDWV
jgi:hypothetical protein